MISLRKGEEVEEVEPDYEGWTVVRKRDGSEGAVPSEHLGREHNLVIIIIISCLGNKKANNNVLKATYSYKGAPGMISLMSDEEVEEVTADVDGWTVVKKKDGTIGPVPSIQLG